MATLVIFLLLDCFSEFDLTSIASVCLNVYRVRSNEKVRSPDNFELEITRFFEKNYRISQKVSIRKKLSLLDSNILVRSSVLKNKILLIMKIIKANVIHANQQMFCVFLFLKFYIFSHKSRRKVLVEMESSFHLAQLLPRLCCVTMTVKQYHAIRIRS